MEITEILLAKAQGKWAHFVGDLASMFGGISESKTRREFVIMSLWWCLDHHNLEINSFSTSSYRVHSLY